MMIDDYHCELVNDERKVSLHQILAICGHKWCQSLGMTGLACGHILKNIWPVLATMSVKPSRTKG